MGFNTAVIVRNDFLHEIKDDPQFGEKLYGAIISNGREYHGQGFSVLPSQHADYMQVVTIGGNSIRSLGFGGSWTAEDKDILKALAASMGYRLVKRSAR